jgi:hypothetical protein
MVALLTNRRDHLVTVGGEKKRTTGWVRKFLLRIALRRKGRSGPLALTRVCGHRRSGKRGACNLRNCKRRYEPNCYLSRATHHDYVNFAGERHSFVSGVLQERRPFEIGATERRYFEQVFVNES